MITRPNRHFVKLCAQSKQHDRPLNHRSIALQSDFRLLILLFAGSLTTMAGSLIAPIVPEMVQQLRLNPALATNLVSLHCLTIALFGPVLGILADRIGRLPVLVGSLVGYAIVGVAGAFLPDITALLITRALLGIASGGIAAASLGLLTSLYEGEARTQAIGYATSTLTFMGIVYPIVGGWLGAINWQIAFWLYGIGLPLAWLCAAHLPSKLSQAKIAHQPDQKLAATLAQPAVLWLLLLLGLASIVMYAVVVYAPLYLKTAIGAGAALNGLVLAIRALGAAIVSAWGTRGLVRRFGTSATIGVGFGLMALTIGSIPLLTQLPAILLAAVLFGVGFGIVMPQLYNLLADLTPPNLRSSLLAIGTGAGFLGQFLSPILFAPVLNQTGLASVFYAAAGVAAISAGLMVFNRSSQSMERSK